MSQTAALRSVIAALDASADRPSLKASLAFDSVPPYCCPCCLKEADFKASRTGLESMKCGACSFEGTTTEFEALHILARARDQAFRKREQARTLAWLNR